MVFLCSLTRHTLLDYCWDYFCRKSHIVLGILYIRRCSIYIEPFTSAFTYRIRCMLGVIDYVYSVYYHVALRDPVVEIGAWQIVLLSDTIVNGAPSGLTISFTYKRERKSALSLYFTGEKWADLIERSTIIQTVSFPPCIFGKPPIKSMEMYSHFHSGISSDWSIPTFFFHSPLTTNVTPRF